LTARRRRSHPHGDHQDGRDDPAVLAAVIDRCVAGDSAALEDLVTAVRDRIFRLALRMTGCREDAEDATQEILVKVVTRLDSFRGDAAPTTWVHRIAVNHLLDRRKSRVERLGFTFESFGEDLLADLADPPERSSPDLDLLADEVRRGCTLAVLTCLDRELRLAYVLGEILQVPSGTGAEICGTTEAAYRKRLSRARGRVRAFLQDSCGLVNRDAACHCRRRVPAAVASGRVDPVAVAAAGLDPDAATAELDALHDAGRLMRAHPDYEAPGRVTEQVLSLVRGRRFSVLDDG
jgi:RNA polymerase sigma factor (sigma-70 family)